MAYCRFSNLNWRCDVYVYEGAEGVYNIHIARRRLLFPPVPRLPDAMLYSHHRLWLIWYNYIHLLSLKFIPTLVIKLSCAGESINADSADGCADILEYLEKIGYRIPRDAVDTLRYEAAELGGC